MGDFLRVIQIDNADPRFYELIGPYLSKRWIVKELGSPVWDDPGKKWWVAAQGEEVAGFVAAVEQRGKIVFCSDYVLPKHRHTGIYHKLFTARISHYQGTETPITATVLGDAAKVYEAHGFKAVGKRGRYTIYGLEGS